MSIARRLHSDHYIQNAYGPKTRVDTHPTGESRAKQQFRDEVNVNSIMAKYEKTGVLPTINALDPKYGFVPSINFHEAMNEIKAAQETFSKLPANVRKEFDNDPQMLVEFMSDESNYEKAIELGLLPRSDSESVTPETVPETASEPDGEPT